MISLELVSSAPGARYDLSALNTPGGVPVHKGCGVASLSGRGAGCDRGRPDRKAGRRRRARGGGGQPVPESFLGALNLIVQAIARLPEIVEDLPAIADWGEELLEITGNMRATVGAPADLQRRVHWDQFLNLSAELGRAAKLVPETRDLTPLSDLEPRLVAEIDAIRESLPNV